MELVPMTLEQGWRWFRWHWFVEGVDGGVVANRGNGIGQVVFRLTTAQPMMAEICKQKMIFNFLLLFLTLT